MTKSISTAKESGPPSVSSYFSEKMEPKKKKNAEKTSDDFEEPVPFKTKLKCICHPADQ